MAMAEIDRLRLELGVVRAEARQAQERLDKIESKPRTTLWSCELVAQAEAIQDEWIEAASAVEITEAIVEIREEAVERALREHWKGLPL